jgi:ABC-type antimicrobial peptide transport system permease subunit
MFFSYLWKELSRRRRQALVVSLGLALGIGLVVAVSAMATGVQQAQTSVLHSLYGVGTDITVTQAPARGSGPGAGFGFGGGQSGQTRHFSRDRIFAVPGQETFAATKATSIAGLSGVRKAAGALNLTAIHINGKLPTFTPGSGFGSVGSPQPQASGAPGRIDVSNYSLAGVDVADTTIGPLSSSQITDGRIFRSDDARSKVAVVLRSYAKQKGLTVGGKITIDGERFTIIGLATPTAEGAGSDVYVPLVRAQAIADEAGKVNTVYVEATSASTIGAAKSSIKAALPSATASTASDLAKEVSGSLSSASNLATHLGAWLSIAALILAIVLASLLTLSSVSRRVRELGTLKALGWRTPRLVGQVMGESLVLGVVGGALGLVIGLAGARVITRLAPSLNATVSNFGGGFGRPGGSFAGAGGFGSGGASNPFGQTVSVPLHAPVSISLVGLAIGLSLIGGAIAGMVGGWRAARMRPADAMRQVV